MELELEPSPRGRTRGQELGSNAAAGAKVIEAHAPSVPDAHYRDRATRNAILDGFKRELDDYRRAMTQYASSDSDVVLLTISAHHARLCEIRSDLVRMSGTESAKLRTSEVDPLIEALGFQFKIHSRLIATFEAELRMTGGMT